MCLLMCLAAVYVCLNINNLKMSKILTFRERGGGTEYGFE